MGTEFQLLGKELFPLRLPAAQDDLCLITLLFLLIALRTCEGSHLSTSHPTLVTEGWKFGFNLSLLLKFSI